MSKRPDVQHEPTSHPHTAKGARAQFGRGIDRLRNAAQFVPSPALVLGSIFSVQLGAAIAQGLFQKLGPGGTVFLRLGFAAIILLLVWRPRLKGYTRAHYITILLFGLTIACMNTSFYISFSRIPLGIAVTLEFVGPLGLALVASRRLRDFLWGVLAAGGIILLAPITGTTLDPLGVFLALLAGAFWAAYILLSGRIGRAFPDGTGLALSMGVAALVLIPVGIGSAGSALLAPRALLVGLGVALLSTVIPFSLELEALRRLPARVFGILMSIEPAMAAMIGFVVLHEALDLRALIALVLITTASIGASLPMRRP